MLEPHPTKPPYYSRSMRPAPRRLRWPDSPTPTEARTEIKSGSWSIVVIRRPVKIPRRAVVVGRIPIHRSLEWSIRRRRLIHVEVDPLRNLVFRGEHVPRPEHAGLDKLVGGQRQRPDNVIIRTEVVERPVGVTENLEDDRRVADGFAVGFDSGARLRSLDQYIVGHCAVRSAFGSRRDRLASGQQPEN